MYVLQNLHWFILLLGALVFFHELGHFLVAKACGVKVLKFSLGFGPRLFGFVRGETEYLISILPLGGYVKMLGDTPGGDIQPIDAPRAFSTKPVWQRSAIVVAGPVFNLILAFGVYIGLFSGERTFADSRLGVVSHGQPAWNAGLRPGDKLLAIDGEPMPDFDVIKQHISARPGQAMSVRFERQGAEHTITLKPDAKDETNIFQEAETRGRVGISPQYVLPVIAVVDGESPAAKAGLKTGDRVTKVGGRAIGAWHELRAAVAEAPAGVPLAVEVQRDGQTASFELSPAGAAPAGLPAEIFSSADAPHGYTGLVSKDVLVASVDADTPAATMGLLPGDRLVAVRMIYDDETAVERPIGVWGVDLALFDGLDARNRFMLTFQRGRELKTEALKLSAKEHKDEFKNVRTRYEFGAKNDPELMDTYLYDRHVGVMEAIAEAAGQVKTDATLIGVGLAKMVQGRLSLDNMGGPIMLFVIAEKSAKRGPAAFLHIMAMISVNLALMNLLPIPVLDGGHLMFCIVEAVRRRPPSLRFREMANVVGLAILLLLMVLVLKNDILKYVLG